MHFSAMHTKLTKEKLRINMLYFSYILLIYLMDVKNINKVL